MPKESDVMTTDVLPYSQRAFAERITSIGRWSTLVRPAVSGIEGHAIKIERKEKRKDSGISQILEELVDGQATSAGPFHRSRTHVEAINRTSCFMVRRARVKIVWYYFKIMRNNIQHVCL